MSLRNKTSERLGSDLILLITAVVWGGGFVAQRAAVPFLGFFSYNGIRFLLAGLVMLPFVIRRVKINHTYLWIIPAGLLLFSGSALQQAGIETTSAGAAGFITGIYVVLVPLLLALFWKHKTQPIIWFAAVAALAGTYLLSTGGTRFNPSKGDLIVLAGSLLWAFHVIVVGLSVKHVDVFVFSVGQFLLCGILHLTLSLFTQPATISSIQASLPAILYGGIGSVAVGFTLQAVGQSRAPATDAALILSLEAVFGAIFGALILTERMNSIQIIGCAIIFGAIIIAQLPSLQISIPGQNGNSGEKT